MLIKESYLLIIGIIFCQYFVFFLKKIVKEKRPDKCIGDVCSTYGFPSGRSTIYGFIAFFLFLKTPNGLGIIPISFLGILSKYYLYQHSLKQLIFGYLLGIIIALILNFF